VNIDTEGEKQGIGIAMIGTEVIWIIIDSNKMQSIKNY